MRLIIDRAKWLRGEGTDRSFLLRVADEKMCCLGFYGLACGLTGVELRGYGSPQSTPAADTWPAWLSRHGDGGQLHQSPSCGALMGFNDSRTLDDLTRESQIAAEFAKHGVEVEFIG